MATIVGARSPLFYKKVAGGLPVILDGSKFTGNIFYVDSAVGTDGAGYGTTPGAPVATIDYAVGLCTANQGDVIIVLPGHTETVIAAGGLDLDVAGITIIGLGAGASRATINFTTAVGADVDVDAANITLKGFLLTCAIDEQTIMVDVNSDDFTMEDFEMRGSATAQPLTMIDNNGGAANAADRMTLRRFKCVSYTAAASANRAVELGEVNDEVWIEDGVIDGDWGDAGIHNPTGKVLTNLRIVNNMVRNRQTGDHAIELVSACTGEAINNRLFGDTLGTIFDPGSLFCAGNLESDAIDQAGVPSPRTMAGDAFPSGIATTSFVAGAINADALGADALTNAKVADDALSEEQFDKDAAQRLTMGIKVSKAAATLPQSTAAAIFTVATGRVVVHAIVGEVTVVIQTQANNTKLTANPTTGTDVDLCAVLDITADEVGCLYGITGTFADAMVGANAGATIAPARPVVVPVGTIDLSCAASNTGQAKWDIYYTPLDTGATITSA